MTIMSFLQMTQELESQIPIIIFSYMCADFDKKREPVLLFLNFKRKKLPRTPGVNYQNKLT